MALSQIYTAVAGQIITAARWNNEFGNIYANGVDLAFPLTKAVSLAGFTLTIDGAGATTLTSTASIGFSLTPGSKAGTPSVNGSFLNLATATYTDTNTAVSGVAANWSGVTFKAPTLAASNTTVTTTNPATLYVEGGPIAGTNETLTNSWAISTDGDVRVGGDLVVRKSDSSRTATVDTPLIVESVTTGTPANGIGTGILLRAASADESTSDIGQLDFTFSDKTAASEDSYFQILLRVAGAALAASYRFVATSAFQSIFTHANAADRTYTFPDYNLTMGRGCVFAGPSSTGTGSTQAHEGTVTISADQALDGIHFYTDFTLNVTKTLTLGAGSHRLIIVATGTITINGTINATGVGSSTGAAGYTQPGGGGGATAAAANGIVGGSCYQHSVLIANGGTAGTGASGSGGAAAQKSGTSAAYEWPFSMMGGAGGGDSGNGAVGGKGGGSIVLIAPRIVLGSASALITSGAVGGTAGVGPGAGGGGAGNIFMACLEYTDSGCTFTLTGGAGRGHDTTGGDGGNGATGVKQINIYA